MSVIGRLRLHWTGIAGPPGLSTFYYDDVLSAQTPLHTFFDAIKALLPSGVRISFDGTGDFLEDTTGALTGTWSTTPAADVVGTGTGGYAGPAGAMILWTTGAVIGRRRLKGKTFLVPIANAALDTDGTLASASLTTARTALATYVSALGTPGQRIWHRPKHGAGGSSSLVTGASIPDKVMVLRSRRD